MTNVSEADRKYLEQTGVENVRIALLTNTNLAIKDRGAAWRWLKEQDDAAVAGTRFFEKTNLGITAIGTVAAIIAAIASVWTLFR